MRLGQGGRREVWVGERRKGYLKVGDSNICKFISSRVRNKLAIAYVHTQTHVYINTHNIYIYIYIYILYI